MKMMIPILLMPLLLAGCASSDKEASFRIIGMDEAMTMMEEEGYII